MIVARLCIGLAAMVAAAGATRLVSGGDRIEERAPFALNQTVARAEQGTEDPSTRTIQHFQQPKARVGDAEKSKVQCDKCNTMRRCVRNALDGESFNLKETRQLQATVRLYDVGASGTRQRTRLSLIGSALPVREQRGRGQATQKPVQTPSWRRRWTRRTRTLLLIRRLISALWACSSLVSLRPYVPRRHVVHRFCCCQCAYCASQDAGLWIRFISCESSIFVLEEWY